MTTTPAFLRQSASHQARLIAANTLTPAGLLNDQLAAIEQLNPVVNAFVQVQASTSENGSTMAASTAAGLPPASLPLAGSTFAVKDNIDVAGLSSHGGLRALHAPLAANDASVVARLKAAGLVCLGKLNMHAMALGATNHNVDFGNCYNPLRISHTPGGSSGGSAAAVAAGLCGIALGTDTMGSVRVPASYCGVVGFKPSFDALPTDGVFPLAPTLDHVGILARSVEDCVYAYSAMIAQGPDSRVHHSADESRTLEFAVPSNLNDLEIDDEVREAFNAGLVRLRASGFSLHPAVIDRAWLTPARRAGLLLSEAGLRHTLRAVLEARRDEIPADLRAMIDFAGTRSATDLAAALSVVINAGRWLTSTIKPYDGLLLPTTPQTAFLMSGPVPHNQADLTALANMSGAPAISLPLPVGAGLLPVGLQMIGHRGSDRFLLDAARRAERVLC